MKRLLLLGCLMMLIGCVRQKTDAKYWMLKGRIAEMREGSAVAYLKFGKWVPDTIDSYDEIHTFDHSGRWNPVFSRRNRTMSRITWCNGLPGIPRCESNTDIIVKVI